MYKKASIETTQSFITKVFGYMFIALIISALSAMFFANNPALMTSLISTNEKGKEGLSILGWVVMLAPIGFVFLMSMGYSKLAPQSLLALFLIYSAINGISFSFILLAYTKQSIIGCFLSTSVMFGVMAGYGWITKKDLTSWGSILLMALIGIIVVMIVNMFLQSQLMEYIISIIGIIVFCALTAYDVQKLKGLSHGNDAIMGALSLYLDFLNMFLFLLRLFGNSSSSDDD